VWLLVQAQLLYSAVHGTAMQDAAEKRDLGESIAELRVIAVGHDELLAEAAGITAGSWYAWPSTLVGSELIAAGMLIAAAGGEGKPSDMTSWSVGRGWKYKRGMKWRKGKTLKEFY
jgi:hypothetical protein